MAESLTWQDISAILREKILSGQLKPGQKFPTNHELTIEYGAYVSTVQNAVNALIREGLVISPGSGNKRRIVRPIIERSVRRGGFLDEFGPLARLEVLELYVTRGAKRLPDNVLKEMEPPLLVYCTRQWRDEIPVALSDSYIPGGLPIYKLKTILADSRVDLYQAMQFLGLQPAICEESLIAAPATPEEEQNLYGATIIQRIKRKVFDPNGNLLELCFLSDRADCYEFVYRFPLEAQNINTPVGFPSGHTNAPSKHKPILVSAGTIQAAVSKGEHEPDLSLMERLEDRKNDIEYWCQLLESNIIVLTNKGKPLKPEQIADFIKYLKESLHSGINIDDKKYKNSPLAAHIEGEPNLKPELVSLMNISTELTQLLKRYLKKEKPRLSRLPPVR